MKMMEQLLQWRQACLLKSMLFADRVLHLNICGNRLQKLKTLHLASNSTMFEKYAFF